MLSLPPSVRLFIARGATDMRKSFDTLAALVIEVIDEDPMSGHLFLFINRRRNRANIPKQINLRASSNKRPSILWIAVLSRRIHR